MRQLVMIGVFLAFVVRKAREEFSRTVEQARDDVLLTGSEITASSWSKKFDYGYVTNDKTDELLVV